MPTDSVMYYRFSNVRVLYSQATPKSDTSVGLKSKWRGIQSIARTSGLRSELLHGAKQQAKRSNSTLQTLGLANIGLSHIDAVPIADMLQNNVGLLQLNLDSNTFGCRGTSIVAESLEVNKTLIDLRMGDNCIAGRGFTRLASALEGNSTLQEIHLHENSVSAPSLRMWREMLTMHGSVLLRMLDFQDCGLTAKNIDHLALALKQNAPVRGLNLARNIIGDNGAAAIGQALFTNSSLTSLDLRQNSITERGLMWLISSFVMPSERVGKLVFY